MLELTFEPDAVRGADWLELSCFTDYPSSISKPLIDAYFESLHYKSPELFSTDILKHIKWRNYTLSNYPLTINESLISSKAAYNDSLAYFFPLLLSTHDFFPDTKIKNWSLIGDLFELFCAASIEQLIGNTVLIGNPLGGFSSDFDTCLSEVCECINELKGPKSQKASDFQDAGVDIIAWHNFDHRKGQISLLVQCASGKNWRKKGSDIKLKLWNQLVFWAVDPIKVLTFPYAYDFNSPEAEIDWIHYAIDGGLLLDRLRLADVDISESSVDLDPIEAWVDQQFKIIQTYILD